MVAVADPKLAHAAESAAPIYVAGRRIQPTVVFDTYWRFAAARQRIYRARLAGEAAPWTSDPILSHHRFTNCYRAADRVSQFLIRNVIYDQTNQWGAVDERWEDVFFRIVLFKVFNRISTWTHLEQAVGEVRWSDYSFGEYDRALSAVFDRGGRLYSAAYVVPPPRLGEDRKHRNHLRLIEQMMTTGAPERIANAERMSDAFEVLRSYPAVGDFLGYQHLIDLNYSDHLQFDEMDFIVPGPGARDGIRKCFGRAAEGIEADLIRYMADTQDEHFQRLGLTFEGLPGRRLQLVDCQNLFCEIDKYSRVAHPEIMGISGRTRIKQSYRQDFLPLSAWFPPKWGIGLTLGRTAALPAGQLGFDWDPGAGRRMA